MESTQKSLQFYTGTYLNDVQGRTGLRYDKYAGLCLEAQNFTDSVNNQVDRSCSSILADRPLLASISQHHPSTE